MRTLTFPIVAAALATAGLAAAAPAIAQGMGKPDMTRAEVQAKAAERFARMDANSDGVLNAADREARRAKMFDRLDTDKNGAISQAEFAARHAARADGAHARHQGVEGGKRGGMKGHRMGGHRGIMGGRMAMARMADTNNDNAISQAEFTAAALKRFDRADADGNGTVTQAERKAAHEAMRAQMQARRAAQPAN
jgi:hypothetical protein